MNTLDRFKLDGKVVIVTGGAGLLGSKHAEAVAEAGGIPVLWDINEEAVSNRAKEMIQSHGGDCLGVVVDITKSDSIQNGLNAAIAKFNKVDVLINNAANDPKVSSGESLADSRFENFSLDLWAKDIAVGLTGAFLCSQVVGAHMAKHGGGVIVNVASDLGIIGPDQRIYRKEGIKDEDQPAKPVTYSVIKHGLIGLSKYLATYWADKKVRVNSISPGGVYTNQPEDFVEKLTGLIPLGRMAHQDEYKAAILFLISDASSYMTGANLVVDGGRTCW